MYLTWLVVKATPSEQISTKCFEFDVIKFDPCKCRGFKFMIVLDLEVRQFCSSAVLACEMELCFLCSKQLFG